MALLFFFPGMLLLFFALMVAALVILPLLCVIDAASRNSQDFLRADSNKALWIVLPLVFGFLAAIVYLVAIRPKLKVLSV